MRCTLSRFVLVCIIVSFIPFTSHASQLRVLLNDTLTHLQIFGKDLKIYQGDLEYPEDYPPIFEMSGDQSITVSSSVQGIQIKARQTYYQNIKITSSTPFQINDQTIYGDLSIGFHPERRTFYLVSIIPLETYLLGVVGHEMSAEWEMEALKAQAVASRTYAMYSKLESASKYYDVYPSILDQVYKGYLPVHPNVKKAVEETKGMILVYKRKPIRAYFHSCCGGHTESAANVWGDASQPYLPSTESSYCNSCSNTPWEYRIFSEEFYEKIRKEYSLRSRPNRIEIAKKNKSGRVVTLKILREDGNWMSVDPNKFRSVIGFTNIKSLKFDMYVQNDMLVFTGNGMGHGVGMCQYGAEGMALSGKNYQNILQYFYPYTNLYAIY